MSANHDRIAYDGTFVHGKPFAAITCAKVGCHVKVLYGLDANTRPKYCPRHETEMYHQFANSEFWKLLPDSTMTERIMEELRTSIHRPAFIGLQSEIKEEPV
jgi:hypothetical protein